ncbi:MAG TPA: bifunctional phosphoribosylaminoimidazolecarboxamide formyltransferase/IMP cyclohydrolase [Bacteroidota bacterium]|nr:bifunctional phosphoribosylaminoimidazolecarboxamide formyltransferase/IMP cyclohydrolase [Bacteroidota bacterium]
MLKIKRALVSVYYKEGLLEFANVLRDFGVQIISTGGTYNFLKSNNIPVISISEITGFPEILDGRVKTLHPKIHAGLLAILDNSNHMKQIEELNIEPIDLVCINLYPFEETVKKEGIKDEEIIEQIDIGGPSMLRAAAKNYKYTAAISNPNQYKSFVEELRNNNGYVSEEYCRKLAKEVFRTTAYYDSIIFNYFDKNEIYQDFPEIFTIGFRKEFSLRYGENPHQKSALYGEFQKIFSILHGKELSYNNILDISSAVNLMLEFDTPAAIIVKHNNPCGVGLGDNIYSAYENALSTDPKSAFGGIIALNRPIDINTANKINEIFSEVIISPDFSNEVFEILKKKKDRRLIKFNIENYTKEKFQIRNVIGGYLVQDIDNKIITQNDLNIVTKRKPSDDEVKAMLFGWKVVKHVKSNAIVFSNSQKTLGIGAGQMSRVDSTKIAIMKAKEFGLDLTNSALASDAFFPFADSILEAIKAGATAIIQPGGSIRDNEVINAANEHNVTMAFTGIRHFKH